MATARPFDESPSALGPPRFSLRTLWLVMTLLCCLFGLMSIVGAMWSLALALFIGLVAAHVLGNSLGTKLSNRAEQWKGPDWRPASEVHPAPDAWRRRPNRRRRKSPLVRTWT